MVAWQLDTRQLSILKLVVLCAKIMFTIPFAVYVKITLDWRTTRHGHVALIFSFTFHTQFYICADKALETGAKVANSAVFSQLHANYLL